MLPLTNVLRTCTGMFVLVKGRTIVTRTVIGAIRVDAGVLATTVKGVTLVQV